ncbi:MAG TPA: pyrroline-5-carboxylate reductase [Pseudoneobacillus sp.]|jgi:pyrroline-5-carboxylate reductase|nr:pyrroline-5-carboxylate reductase [Pseudoneobacillus sp.]
MNQKVGFIGCGKMAQAMIEGMIRSKVMQPEEIMASAKTDETLQSVKEKNKILVSSHNIEVAKHADILILAIKPNIHDEILKEIAVAMDEQKVIITIAAGISLEYIESFFQTKVKVVRAMPNTPSLVGEGMSAICHNEQINQGDLEKVLLLFNSFGKTEVMVEELMDSIPAISGSSPAYVYMFIEALADGGVKQGIPRKQAYKLAAQAVLGAAKMVLETGNHPGELKDNVCTPGGATIEAVAALEQEGFRSAILTAMDHCTQKSKQLSNKNE